RWSAYRHFFPLSVLFFPIVERLSIHLMDGGVCDFHVARLSSEKEINVVSLAVGGFHIHAGEVFSAAEIGEPVVVHPYQVEREIVALMAHVKLSVAGLFSFSLDVFLNPGGNVSRTDAFLLALYLLGMFFGFLCFGMFGMLLRTDGQCRRQEKSNRCCQNKSCKHNVNSSFLLRLLIILHQESQSEQARIEIHRLARR